MLGYSSAGKSPASMSTDPATPRFRKRQLTFAAQELRLISLLVLLMAVGLFLALPFVLSIGSVVFLPLVTAIMITIVLAPLADRLADWGMPNVLAAFLSIVSLIGLLAMALALILQPAVSLVDQIPQMTVKVARQFNELRGSLAWLSNLNQTLTEMAGDDNARQVVLAGPSLIQELALATPSVILEVLLTFLLAFFMVSSRVRFRRRIQTGAETEGISHRAARVVRDVQNRVSAYIHTVAVINLGVGVIVAGGAWALGVEAPIMWGGLAAILNFLPYIGPLAMTALLTLFGLGTAETMLLGLLPAAAYLGLHTIESNLITPAILGARFTMSPVLILLALSYFSWIWGATGALLSVPILLTVTALFDHLGKPNLLGFLFGEPLFETDLLALSPEETDEKAC